MDTTRYEELTVKRDGVGLSDEEADELGKMVAEIEKRAYSNASSDPCGHLGCGCSTGEPYCGEFCATHATEPSEAGPEFDCGCGHDACKALVGEA